MIAVLSAHTGRHAPPAARMPLRGRLAAVLAWHPLRALRIRRWSAALRRDAAELAEGDREFRLRERAVLPERGAPALLDIPGAVLTPSYYPRTNGDGMITVSPDGRIGIRRNPAPTLTDMTIVVHHPEFDTRPVSVIGGGRPYARHWGTGGGTAVIGAPFEYREVSR